MTQDPGRPAASAPLGPVMLQQHRTGAEPPTAGASGAALLARAPQRDPQQLLLRTAEGSKEAFGALYDLVSPRVFAMMSSLVPDGESAERLTETAFRQVWAGAPHYRSDHGDALRWVLRVAYRSVHDRALQAEAG